MSGIIAQLSARLSARRRSSANYRRQRSFAVENSNLVSSLSPQEVESFRRVFKLFDKDQDDLINAGELAIALRSLGLTPTEEEVQDMVKEVDVDGSGDIAYEEFLALMARGTVNTSLESQARDAFLAFDNDGDGYINASDLREAIQNIGNRKISNLEAEDLLHEAQSADSHDGLQKEMRISYEEFLEFLCSMSSIK